MPILVQRVVDSEAGCAPVFSPRLQHSGDAIDSTRAPISGLVAHAHWNGETTSERQARVDHGIAAAISPVRLLSVSLSLCQAVDEWSKATFVPLPGFEVDYQFGVLGLRMSVPGGSRDIRFSYKEFCPQSTDQASFIDIAACRQMRAGGILAMIAGIITLLLQTVSLYFALRVMIRASMLPLYVVRLWRFAGLQFVCLVLALAQWLFGGQLVWQHETGDFFSVHLGASWGLLCAAMVLQWATVFWYRQAIMCTAPADVAAAGGEALPPHVQYAAPLAIGGSSAGHMPPFAYPVVQAAPYAPVVSGQAQPGYIPPTAGYMPPPQQNPSAYAPLQQ